MKVPPWVRVPVLGLVVTALNAAPSAAQGDGPQEMRERVVAPGAPVLVSVRSDVGSDLRFVEATLFLNGRRVARRTAPAGGELPRTTLLWSSTDAKAPPVDRDGWLPLGEHAMTATLTFEGRAVGPFTYLAGYRYNLDANFIFTIEPNSRPVSVQLAAHERANTEIPDRDKIAISVQPGPDSGAVPALDPRGRRR
jgi:hypothetical protein